MCVTDGVDDGDTIFAIIPTTSTYSLEVNVFSSECIRMEAGKVISLSIRGSTW